MTDIINNRTKETKYTKPSDLTKDQITSIKYLYLKDYKTTEICKMYNLTNIALHRILFKEGVTYNSPEEEALYDAIIASFDEGLDRSKIAFKHNIKPDKVALIVIRRGKSFKTQKKLKNQNQDKLISTDKNIDEYVYEICACLGRQYPSLEVRERIKNLLKKKHKFTNQKMVEHVIKILCMERIVKEHQLEKLSKML